MTPDTQRIFDAIMSPEVDDFAYTMIPEFSTCEGCGEKYWTFGECNCEEKDHA